MCDKELASISSLTALFDSRSSRPLYACSGCIDRPADRNHGDDSQQRPSAANTWTPEQIYAIYGSNSAYISLSLGNVCQFFVLSWCLILNQCESKNERRTMQSPTCRTLYCHLHCACASKYFSWQLIGS